jgi:lipid II:glycine glycyltransferase (peptidoglycan interpeptide bridge formation enzyme)
MELQQSSDYAKYITTLNWQVFTVDGVRMFYKKIPFMGGLLKIQRPEKLPSVIPLVKNLHIKTVAVDPKETQNIQEYKKWINKVSKYCRVVRSGYMSTKTIRVNLRPPEEQIFSHFSEAKRRAVRKAQKNSITVNETADIRELIRIKNKSGGFMGFITTVGIDKFWNIAAPRHATIVLAYTQQSKLVGGILIVFWNTIAYYWVAGATREGKKLFAPTLLVWEAIRVAKKHGAKEFDFLGVWDERKPAQHHDWKGFTRFKEGFGGTTLYYPIY